MNECTDLLPCPICGKLPVIDFEDELGAFAILRCPNNDLKTSSIIRENYSLDDTEVSKETFCRLCEMWQSLVCEKREV